MTAGHRRAVMVPRVSPQAAFSHVVAYHHKSSALTGVAHSLLDAASYGRSTWVALSPVAPAGVSHARPSRSRATPAPSLSLVGAP